MKKKNVILWSDYLMNEISKIDRTIFFSGEQIKIKKRNDIQYVKKRSDGLYDSLFIEYEYWKTEDPEKLQMSEGVRFGWYTRIQYAINKESHCPIPCTIDGGYANLLDLTEYIGLDQNALYMESFYLGEKEEDILFSLKRLAYFLSEAVPLFSEKIIKERL